MIDSRVPYKTYRVTLTATYQIPASLEDRAAIGYPDDPRGCFEIDMESDPAMTLRGLMADHQLVSITEVPDPSQTTLDI